ncbi:glycine zipper domain-containing protein [Rickettsiales endosymbiont of Stachyamoeba lipophora]|uniref:glycine zipper domain-containing protein n=1 Tax=Rickettsiales endosymbiont of Stachyamoeba lipophora TaxID=2486578 RepID=UPI000F64AC13|nr:glycine zipper domain-containing protein [Rickettsiales endosymbiont of Stachyamoeba lipophora]AZL16196.1 hypothetical protein EF513_06600 [Rickettsiales endosymbiont of Stachyamoeba lipophora]
MLTLVKSILIGLIVVSLTSGCAEHNKYFTKATLGATLGALTGGAIGANVKDGKGAVVGVVAGAVLGKWVAGHLDPLTQDEYNIHTQQTLETMPIGQTSEWNKAEKRIVAKTMPVKTFKNNDNFCREYTQTVEVGDEKKQARGIACRKNNGMWEIVD